MANMLTAHYDSPAEACPIHISIYRNQYYMSIRLVDLCLDRPQLMTYEWEESLWRMMEIQMCSEMPTGEMFPDKHIPICVDSE